MKPNGHGLVERYEGSPGHEGSPGMKGSQDTTTTKFSKWMFRVVGSRLGKPNVPRRTRRV